MNRYDLTVPNAAESRKIAGGMLSASNYAQLNHACAAIRIARKNARLQIETELLSDCVSQILRDEDFMVTNVVISGTAGKSYSTIDWSGESE